MMRSVGERRINAVWLHMTCPRHQSTHYAFTHHTCSTIGCFNAPGARPWPTQRCIHRGIFRGWLPRYLRTPRSLAGSQQGQSAAREREMTPWPRAARLSYDGHFGGRRRAPVAPPHRRSRSLRRVVSPIASSARLKIRSAILQVLVPFGVAKGFSAHALRAKARFDRRPTPLYRAENTRVELSRLKVTKAVFRNRFGRLKGRVSGTNDGIPVGEPAAA